MEINIHTREYMIDGVISREHTTLATPETIEVLRLYSGLNLRVGDTVRIRNEDIERRGGTVLKIKRPTEP